MKMICPNRNLKSIGCFGCHHSKPHDIIIETSITYQQQQDIVIEPEELLSESWIKNIEKEGYILYNNQKGRFLKNGLCNGDICRNKYDDCREIKGCACVIDIEDFISTDEMHI